MKSITAEIAKQIQDINGDPGLTPEDKIKKIHALDGASFEFCLSFLEKNYSTGPELAAAIKKLISKKRPKGAKKKRPKNG
jgi:hypothetical protein